MNFQENKKQQKNVKSINIYSKRQKRTINKTFNLNRYSELYINMLIKKFIEEVEQDNINYLLEKTKDKHIIKNDVNDIVDKNDNVNDIVNKNDKDNLPKISISNIINKIVKDESASNICIFGASKSGKSTLIIEMIKQWILKDPHIIVVCFFGNLNIHTYDELLNNKNIVIFNGLKPSIIYTLWLVNSMRIDNKYEFLIIVDDIIQARNLEVLNNLAMSYRNQRLNSMFSLQSIMLINPSARNNSTLYMFLKNKMNETQKIMDNFLNSNPHFINIKKKHKIVEYIRLTNDYNIICNFPLNNEDLLIANTKNI